jgi:hypothetical protein
MPVPQNRIKKKDGIALLAAAIVFLLLNTLKITLFNYYIIPVQTIETFRYKFEIALLLSLALYPVIFKMKSRIGFIVFYIVQTLYILVNISYYMFYHNYLHFLQWMTLFGEAVKSAGHSAEPLSIKMLIVLIDLPAFLYLAFNYFKVVKLNFEIRKLRRVLTVVSLVMVIFIANQNNSYGSYMLKDTSERYKGESPIVF